MIIVVDASVLVAELLRARGRALLRDPGLDIAMTAELRSEADYELERRLRFFNEQRRMAVDKIATLRREVQAVIATIEVVQRVGYEHLEVIARRRIPRDPNDWPTVALAIALDADILTNDHDFLGCGCATWTFEAPRDELVHLDSAR